MRKIKKTDSKIVISENTQNKILETFISMKFDTECNETTPAIIFNLFHDYYKILTKHERAVPTNPEKINPRLTLWASHSLPILSLLA